MDQELDQQDWQQIALFYQKKFSELELNVLAMELKLQKAQANADASSDESDD